MARFYLDEMMSKLAARALRDLDHDVLTAQEAHQKSFPDYIQLLTASNDRRILLTKNRRDFVLLHGAWYWWSIGWQVDESHAGILVVPDQLRDDVIAQHVDSFLREHPSFANRLFTLRPPGMWVEHSIRLPDAEAN